MTPDWYTYPDIDKWLDRYMRGEDWHTEPCERVNHDVLAILDEQEAYQDKMDERPPEELLEDVCQTEK